MTQTPARIGDFLDFEMYGDAPPRQNRPQPRRTALSIIRRIVATIRRERS